MKNLYLLIILFSFIALFSSVALQSQTINGYVCVQKDKTPIEFATVTLIHLPDSAVITGSNTLKNGSFMFSGVKPGKYFLKTDFLGYRTGGKQVKLSSNQSVLKADTIFLLEVSQQIKEVTVTGARIEAKELVDRTVYNIPSEIAKTSANGFEILKKIPSIQVDFQNNVTLNGSTNFIIQVDGKIRDKEFLAKINPADFESIEVISNPSGKYEGNIDGVLNIILKKTARAGTTGNVTVQFRTSTLPTGYASAGIDYGTGKVTYYATGYSWNQIVNIINQSSYLDTLSSRTMSSTGKYMGSYNSINTGFDYYFNDRNNLNFNINFRPTVNISNSPSTGTTDSLRNGNPYLSLVSNQIAFNQTISQEGTVSMFYKRTYKKPIKELSAEARFYRFHSYVKSKLLDTLSNDGFSFSYLSLNHTYNDRTAYTLKLDYVQPIGISARMETGFQFYDQLIQINFDQEIASQYLQYSGYNESGSLFSYNELRNAAYVGFIDNINKLSLQATVRVENSIISIRDTSGLIQYSTLLPSGNVQYKITKKQNVKLTYNRRIVRPAIGDLNPNTVISQYSESKGNPGLLPEYYDRFQLTYTVNFGKNYLSPNVYYTIITNKKGTEISFPYSGSGFSLSQPRNLLTGYEEGFGLNGMLWFFNVNARFYQGHYDAVNNLPVPIPAKTYSSFALNSYAFAPLPKDIKAFAFINYNGPSLNAYSRTTSTPFYGLGANKTFGDHMIQLVYLLPFRSTIIMSNTVTNTPASSASMATSSTASSGFNCSYFIMLQYTYKFHKGKTVKKIIQQEENETDSKIQGLGK